MWWNSVTEVVVKTKKKARNHFSRTGVVEGSKEMKRKEAKAHKENGKKTSKIIFFLKS